MMTTTTATKQITIDPSDPFAGLLIDEDQTPEALVAALEAAGSPERLAIEILSAASAAGCGTWDDAALRALTRAIEEVVS